MKTAILGAGVSGLSLARFLVEGGLPLGDVHLFEASTKVGGLCGSKTVDGFTYDVVDRAGQVIERVQLPKDHVLVGFGPNNAVYLTKADGKATYLERALLTRSGPPGR